MSNGQSGETCCKAQELSSVVCDDLEGGMGVCGSGVVQVGGNICVCVSSVQSGFQSLSRV